MWHMESNQTDGAAMIPSSHVGNLVIEHDNYYLHR